MSLACFASPSSLFVLRSSPAYLSLHLSFLESTFAQFSQEKGRVGKTQLQKEIERETVGNHGICSINLTHVTAVWGLMPLPRRSFLDETRSGGYWISDRIYIRMDVWDMESGSLERHLRLSFSQAPFSVDSCQVFLSYLNLSSRKWFKFFKDCGFVSKYLQFTVSFIFLFKELLQGTRTIL